MLLAVGAFLTAAGQESKTIMLDMASDKTSELQKFSCCEVTATLSGSYDNAQVEIKLGNTATDYSRLVLFNEAYNKKELKAKKYKLEKVLGYTVEKCNNLNRVVYIDPNYDEVLFTVRNLKSDTTLKFRLPVYSAVEKNTFLGLFGKKRVLVQCDVVEVSVKVQLADPIVKELEQRYEDLKKETDGKTFCPNKLHTTGDNSAQKEKYEKQKSQLAKDIEQKMAEDYGKGRKNYRLENLLENVKAIQFEVKDCGRHPDHVRCRLSHKGHGKCEKCGKAKSCSYCKSSYKQLASTLDKIFARSNRGKNISEKDKAVVSDIRECVNNKERKDDGKKSTVINLLNTLK